MRLSIPRFCLTLLLLIALVVGAARAADAQAVDARLAGAIDETLRTGRHPYLQHANLAAEQKVLQQLYQQHQFAPLWFDRGTITRQALQLLQLLRNAASFGLRASDYDGTTLAYRLITLATDANKANTATEARAHLEVGLSVAALRLIKHLHYGRIDPRQAGFELNTTRGMELDPVASLTQLAGAQDLTAEIASFEPQYLHYRLLKAGLARYRLLAVDAELTQLPSFTQRSIKPGETYAGAPALRRLLAAEQDLRADAAAPADQCSRQDRHDLPPCRPTNQSLDPVLVAALKQYQTRHGLPADGALGKQTFAALTTPFTQRVRQIELTLERWRWLPPPQSPMIVVNIPQFKLFAFNALDDRETTLLRMDVIVGQDFPHTRTPVFLADMKYVVFRPYWDVPISITRRELLPAINLNPAYLQQHHMELVSGQADNSPVVPPTPDNVAQLATGKIRLRQQPGADNALGDIKFMLPNQYNVYLHSTPATRLFSESRRAFSHGCIRVSDPVALAEYVLRNTSDGWTKEKIETAMQAEPNQRVYLQKSIPVMIVYGTAMPLESGAVQFFDDIYGYDAKLAKLLR